MRHYPLRLLLFRYTLKNVSIEISQFQQSDASSKCCEVHHWRLLEPEPICIDVDFIGEE